MSASRTDQNDRPSRVGREVVVCRLGRTEYRPAWDLQRRIQTRLIEDKRAVEPERIPHVFLLVEHPPVYTLGKSGEKDNLLASEEDLRRRGASFVQIDRGGDITYHGPGQIVGYPILDLDDFTTDIHLYLRNLEEMIIRTCSDFGVAAGRVDDRTGVWVGPDSRGSERKICAMGIRCSRWVTMHGFAMNVDPDLSDFGMIIPCGIDDRGVTSLVRETDRTIEMSDVEARIIHHFGDVFGAGTRLLDGPDANRYIEAYLSGSIRA
ncbi:MAG: lipoyl(octanoyl) transferase LipB [Rhodothermales bacterium]|nr:lipoyl(octanoyl) transferase LipB [Rhodothermales bacterium]